MDLNPIIVEEVEAYFARNAGRDREAVKREVFGILDAAYVRAEHLAGGFVPKGGAALGGDDADFAVALPESSGSVMAIA